MRKFSLLVEHISILKSIQHLPFLVRLVEVLVLYENYSEFLARWLLRVSAAILSLWIILPL